MKSACWIGVVIVAVVISLFANFNRGLRADAVGAPKDAGAGPRVGEACTVYFRGDASGVAFGDRVPGLGNLITRSGTVAAVDETWLELRAGGGKSYRVPRASVLVLECESPKDGGENKPAK